MFVPKNDTIADWSDGRPRRALRIWHDEQMLPQDTRGDVHRNLAADHPSIMIKKVVLFDVGGVLLTQDSGSFEQFDHAHGLQPGTTDRVWKEYLRLAHVGDITSPDRFTAFPLRPKFVHFHYRTNRIFPGMGPVLSALSTKYRLGIISNFTTDLEEVLGQIGVRQYFDHVVNSAFERMTKPDPRIYRAACAKFNVRPEATVFVDDLQTNVSAARDIGMDAIKFCSPAQLAADLRLCGIQVAEI